MSLKYTKVPTTYEVYSALIKAHFLRGLTVFESYTNIVENGKCTVYTVWGLRNAEVALMGAETIYERVDDVEVEGTRTYEYWLCCVTEEKDDV